MFKNPKIRKSRENILPRENGNKIGKREKFTLRPWRRRRRNVEYTKLALIQELLF